VEELVELEAAAAAELEVAVVQGVTALASLRNFPVVAIKQKFHLELLQLLTTQLL
jgi:hypothetical protein